MIVSHKYKFIFIKTFKTASSSFEAAFSWLAGPDDILTPDEPVTTDYDTRAWRNYQNGGFYNHMHGKDIREQVGHNTWNEYYKFVIERNPWDKAISWYFWHKQFWNKPKSIKDFVLNELPKPDWPMYANASGPFVNDILRFENLQEEMQKLESRFGFELRMPRVKGGIRPEHTSYRLLLGPLEKRKIAEVFQDIIRYQDYTY